jgi:hypothetical protein
VNTEFAPPSPPPRRARRFQPWTNEIAHKRGALCFQPPSYWRSSEIFISNLLARGLRPTQIHFAAWESLVTYTIITKRLRAAGVVDPDAEARLDDWLAEWGLSRERYEQITAIVNPAWIR